MKVCPTNNGVWSKRLPHIWGHQSLESREATNQSGGNKILSILLLHKELIPPQVNFPPIRGKSTSSQFNTNSLNSLILLNRAYLLDLSSKFNTSVKTPIKQQGNEEEDLKECKSDQKHGLVHWRESIHTP